MKAAIVTIGDELLIGQVIDTNSVFIGSVLEQIGCTIVEKTSVSDSEIAILEVLKRFQNKVDLVILTGGLGPTKDDVTKRAFVRYFDDELVLNTDVFTHVKQLMEDFYQRPISEVNILQAYVPSKGSVLFNDVGTAPGMLMIKEQTTFVSLPGVPFEMKHLVNEKLVPYIKEHFKLNAIVHTTILTEGIGESLLAEKIALWEDSLSTTGVKLFYLPQLGMVRLRLSKTGADVTQIQKEINQKIVALEKLIPDFFIGVSDAASLLEEVSQLLKAQHLSIATAESCTGGNLAQQLTSLEGSSDYYKGSAVTYATESKVRVLDVRQDTINTYSVVSEEVAKEMAIGVKKLFQTDIAVATTGNAGPLKGDSDKEVGTVCIAIATPDVTKAFTFDFGQPRSKVIEAAVHKVWFLLYKYLKNRK